jgi:hypothetical protein
MDWSSMTGRILEMAILFCAINVDNKANFRYPVDYSFRLMQASICRTAAEADTQLANFA